MATFHTHDNQRRAQSDQNNKKDNTKISHPSENRVGKEFQYYIFCRQPLCLFGITGHESWKKKIAMTKARHGRPSRMKSHRHALKLATWFNVLVADYVCNRPIIRLRTELIDMKAGYEPPNARAALRCKEKEQSEQLAHAGHTKSSARRSCRVILLLPQPQPWKKKAKSHP